MPATGLRLLRNAHWNIRALFACIDPSFRPEFMRRALYHEMTWPQAGPSNKAYRAAGCLVYCWIWWTLTIAAAGLLNIAAIAVGVCTREWRYALVLVFCSWVPALFILGIIIWMIVVLLVENVKVWELEDAARAVRRVVREEHRRREREVQEEFEMAVATLEQEYRTSWRQEMTGGREMEV